MNWTSWRASGHSKMPGTSLVATPRSHTESLRDRMRSFLLVLLICRGDEWCRCSADVLCDLKQLIIGLLVSDEVPELPANDKISAQFQELVVIRRIDVSFPFRVV